MVQLYLNQHHMTHHQKSWHLMENLHHGTTQKIQYWTYHLTWIQIQVFQMTLFRIHLSHQTAGILKKGDVQIKIKNTVQWYHQKVRKSYSQPTYSRAKIKGNKVQIGWGSTTSKVLFLIFHELPETCSPHFKETYMFLKDYQSIRDEYLPDYYKEATWNLLHTYIDEHSQRFI